MLPVYPMLCLLAACGAIVALVRRVRRARVPLAARSAAGRSLRGSSSASTTTSCSRAPTRAVARDWMVAEHPGGHKIVVEPIAPDQWAMDVGHPSRLDRGTGHRWAKWRDVAELQARRGRCQARGLRAHAAARRCSTATPAAATAIVLTGSTAVRAARCASRRTAPERVAYYDELERRGRVLYRVSPLTKNRSVGPFSFDFSFNYYPLDYARPGPEIVYRPPDLLSAS